MPDSKFLETYPLYRKFKTEIPSYLYQIKVKPPINMYCEECKDIRTFNMSGEYFGISTEEIDRFKGNVFTDYKKLIDTDTATTLLITTKGKVVKVEYLCSYCIKYIRTFILKFSPDLDYIMKVGQDPPWDISISKDLNEILGEYSDTYKKGLVCESQSYGIGAFAYYRRIVEEIIESLLISIQELIEPDKKQDYLKALEEVKKQKNADRKIELVMDILPKSLMLDGENPLRVLHKYLSIGIHNKSDDECLEMAEDIRVLLEFLVKEIINTRESRKTATDRMKKILGRKI